MHNPSIDKVMEKIRCTFPDRDEKEIYRQLQAYGTESYERENLRVYLAILKLCSEKGLSKLSHYINEAKNDYRDVLSWAEYPNEIKSPVYDERTPEKIEKVRKLDQSQYNHWLNG